MWDIISSNFQITGICLAVLIFLIVRIVLAGRADKERTRQKRLIEEWRAVFDRCRDRGNYGLTDEQIAWFSSSSRLRAFDGAGVSGDSADCARVLRANSSKIADHVTRHADNDEKGYFAYILSTLDLKDLDPDQRRAYVDLALGLIENNSVFCRENALKALYSLGDPLSVAEALRRLGEDDRYHSEKLLADGMNSFKGDIDEFARILMSHFDEFSGHYQSAIISFLTRANIHSYDGVFKERLRDDSVSVDVKCDILRILMRLPSEEIRDILIGVLREKGHSESWQTAAVAATGLSAYPNDSAVTDALSYGITSPSWDVRMNSANALVKLDPPKELVDGILNGSDRFASDALRFAIANKEKKA